MPSPDLTTLELLKRLVAFDTTSRNSNLDLIAFVGDYLKGYGIDSELVHDDTGAKANLYATIGPRRDGGIVLAIPTWALSMDKTGTRIRLFCTTQGTGYTAEGLQI